MAPYIPKIARKPTDEWSVREKLALAAAVLRCGDNNWASVSRLIRPFAEPSRPSDWFSQKNAALQYSDLLENLEIPKRKRGEKGENTNDTPANLIARKLRIQRIEELQKLIQEEQQLYKEKRALLERLERGELDGQLPQMVQQVKESDKQKLEAEQAQQLWRMEREAKTLRKEPPTSPLLTSLLSTANPTLSKLLEMPPAEAVASTASASLVPQEVEPEKPPHPVLAAETQSDIVVENPPAPEPELPAVETPTEVPEPAEAVVIEEPAQEEVATILEVVQPVEVEIATATEEILEEPMEAPSPQPSIPEPTEDLPMVVEEEVVVEEILAVPSPGQEETVEALPPAEVQEEEVEPSIPDIVLPQEETVQEVQAIEEELPAVVEPEKLPVEPPKPEPEASEPEPPVEPVVAVKLESPMVMEEVSLPESKPEEEIPAVPEEKPAPSTPKVSSHAKKGGTTSRRRGRPPKVEAELSLVESLPNSPSFPSEDPELTKEYKTWKKSIMLIWNSAANHKYANTFLHPVTEDVAPGYHQIVLRPMDLSLIKKNIEVGGVRSTLEVERDMLLMFNNAIMYNCCDHNVYSLAKQMQAEVINDFQTFKATQMMLQGPDQKVLRCRKTEEEEGRSKRKRSSLSEDNAPKKRRARLE